MATDMNAAILEQALEALGAVLAERGLRYELVAVGGSSLMLLGLLARPTKDLDVVARVEEGAYVRADPLPQGLADAVRDVGVALDLAGDWLNAGPASLMDFGLPQGFEERTTIRRFGGLALHVVSRRDQICLKLYAATDQGMRSKHADDLRRLRPTRGELLAGARWTRTHDPSEGFRQILLHTLHELGVNDVEAEL